MREIRTCVNVEQRADGGRAKEGKMTWINENEKCYESYKSVCVDAMWPKLHYGNHHIKCINLICTIYYQCRWIYSRFVFSPSPATRSTLGVSVLLRLLGFLFAFHAIRWRSASIYLFIFFSSFDWMHGMRIEYEHTPTHEHRHTHSINMNVSAANWNAKSGKFMK